MRHQKLSQTKNAIAPKEQHEAIAPPQTQSHASDRHSPHPIEELQGAIGNRAVNRLLANQPVLQAKPMFKGLSGELGSASLVRSAQSPTPIQAKLAISLVGDKHEEEAHVTQQDELIPEEPQTSGKGISPSGIHQENKTGLPDRLKIGIENLSGYLMDEVKVHYNSDKPAQLQAHAYAQGTDIHVAPGQEQHLPHEAWHVVQQKQGRVKPTGQDREVAINDDTTLEHEADVMGKRVNSFEDGNLLGKTVGDSGMMENDLSSTSFPIVLQRVKTSFTNDLRNANPAYLRELSTIDNPGLWDYTNQGTFAVSHKGRKYALGVDDAEYSDRILARKTRTKWGWGRYHFRQEIDVKDDQIKNNLHGRDCSNAAEYLMHYEQSGLKV